MATKHEALLLAIDPGIDTGWAVFNTSGELGACGVGRPPVIAPYVVIEKPQVYRGRGSKGDPNDLITLAVGVGRYAQEHEAGGANVAFTLPHAWKGTIKKEIHHPRIERALNPAERARLAQAKLGVPAGKVHNMLDAIGLGKWALSQENLFHND